MTDTAPQSWINALQNAMTDTGGQGAVELVETHISWVLLTGHYAYKIKKPVNLGFVDFSTLEKRHHFCAEELRLNRRLAPQLYLDVVSIHGSAAQPHLGGSGPVLDYAVRMVEFPKHALASTLLDEGQLSGAHIDAFAATLAAFHNTTGIAAAGNPYGTPEAIYALAYDNCLQLMKPSLLLRDAADAGMLTQLRAWTEQAYETHWTTFAARLVAGEVRECHGDLHLGNLVLLDGVLTPFDCIEFNPALRWIDVMSEVAFLMMDLQDRNRADLAWRFLNAYLDSSGKHDGLSVLRFYLVYRAMVRAKVHALRAAQAIDHVDEQQRLRTASRHYLALAQRYAHDAAPSLILMHGLSGSGKSAIARAIAEHCGALWLRSDVERKRLAGLAATARSGSTLNAGLYSTDQTQATYDRLADLARTALAAGWTTVVDATFLTRAQRDRFRALTMQRHVRHVPQVRCVIMHVTAPEAALRARIAARTASGVDASEADQAVLTAQRRACEPLTADETRDTLTVDSARHDARTVAAQAVAALQARLQDNPYWPQVTIHSI